MSQRRVSVIGCGDFGGQVVLHLEARGMARPEVLSWHGAASTRRAGAEIARQRLGGLELPTGRPLHLVAAADEAAGSGMLVSILSELGSQYDCSLWLALPRSDGDAAARARVYATLLELEALRRGDTSHGVWLCERGGDPTETAQRFGDALLYHARRGASPHTPDSPYRGFGLGVLRDPVATLRRRLAHQVTVRVVEQYLRSPDPAHLLPGLTEALQRPIRPLLSPVEACPVFQHRWTEVTGGGGSLEALLDYYEPAGNWHREAWLFWDRLVGEARTKLASAMGHAWRSGFEVVHAEARAALALAHAVLESEIEQCEQSVLDHQERFEAAHLAAARGEVSLNELDRLVAAYLLEAVRLGALDRLAMAIDGAVELVLDGLWTKAEAVRRLLQSVKNHRPGPPTIRAAHALTMVPSAQQEQVWLDEIQPRLTRAALYDAESPTVEMLLEHGERDVLRYIRTRQPDLHLPRGHRIREVWLDGTLPRIRLTGQERPTCAYEVSPNLPEPYWDDLLTRSSALRAEPVAWFPDEWVVYAETPPFAVGQLADLTDWAAGYQAAPPAARSGLHALPEPPGGWPGFGSSLSAPQSAAAAALVGEAAVDRQQGLVALRSILLGMITPDGAGNLTLQIRLNGWEPGHPVGGLGDLMAALRAGGMIGAQLEALAGQRRQQLPLPSLAGYYALLRWFQTAILDGDRGSLGQHHLLSMHQAVEVERTAVVRQLKAAGEEWLWRAEELTRDLGSPRDTFSMGAGPWRYLRPAF